MHWARLLESVYEVVLAYELRKRGFAVERQVPIAILYDNMRFDEGFRADWVINGKLIIELKSIEHVLPVHSKQVLTQLRMSGLKLGLLINFGEPYFKSAVERIINGNLETEGGL